MLEEVAQSNAEKNRMRQEVRDSQAAITRFEQVQFRLTRLGKSRSLHEIFERTRHFYYPQRLLIACSVSNVGIVFVFAVYMFGIKALCVALTSLRIQFMNLLAQINGFIGAAPSYLQLMLNDVNSLQVLAGASFLFKHARSCRYLAFLGTAADSADDVGLPAGVSAYLQQGAKSATAASSQVALCRNFAALK